MERGTGINEEEEVNVFYQCNMLLLRATASMSLVKSDKDAMLNLHTTKAQNSMLL